MEIFRKVLIHDSMPPTPSIIYYVVENNGKPVITVVLGEECRISEDHPQPFRDDNGYAGFKGSNRTELLNDLRIFDIWNPKHGDRVSYLAIDKMFGIDMNPLRPIETPNSTGESYIFNGDKIVALYCEQAFLTFPLRFTVDGRSHSLEIERGADEGQEQAARFIMSDSGVMRYVPINGPSATPSQLLTRIRQLLRNYVVSDIEQNEFDSNGRRPFLLAGHQVHSVRSGGMELLLEVTGGDEGGYRLMKPRIRQPGSLSLQGIMDGSEMDLTLNYSPEDEMDLDAFILDAIIQYYDTVVKGPELAPTLPKMPRAYWVSGWNRMIQEGSTSNEKEVTSDSPMDINALRRDSAYQELTILSGIFVHKSTGDVYNPWTNSVAKSLFEEEIPLILIERWLGNDKNELRIPYKVILADIIE